MTVCINSVPYTVWKWLLKHTLKGIKGLSNEIFCLVRFRCLICKFFVGIHVFIISGPDNVKNKRIEMKLQNSG
jgi:hypothetical protein